MTISTIKYVNIKLSASYRNWRLYMTRKADSAFLSFQNNVFLRDNNTCRSCGFSSKLNMDIANADNNLLNNKKSNLMTACPFCVQCNFLQAVGLSPNTGGVLIYLPEMTQAELNALCHNIFSAMCLEFVNAKESKNIYRSLRLRSKVVEKELGRGFSSPSFYGQALIDSKPQCSSKLSHQVADKVRLLPSFQAFSGLIDAWASESVRMLS